MILSINEKPFMKELSRNQASDIRGGGKFCDFVAGAGIASGAMGLMGAPVPGGRVTGAALLAASIYCSAS